MLHRRTLILGLAMAGLAAGPATAQPPAEAPIQASAQASAENWGEAKSLTVKMSNFKFDPSTITLRHGVTYTLHLENLSSGGHDFQAKAFFAQAKIRPADQDKVVNGRVALHGRESAHVTLIAPEAGTYPVHCTHFLHSAFGMTAQIVVE